MPLPLAPIFLGSQLVIAVTGSVPTVNIQNTCKAAASVTSGTSVQQDINICVSSEEKACETMVKDWSNYPAVDRSRCVQAGPKVTAELRRMAHLPEMEVAVRKMRAEDKNNCASADADAAMILRHRDRGA